MFLYYLKRVFPCVSEITYFLKLFVIFFSFFFSVKCGLTLRAAVIIAYGVNEILLLQIFNAVRSMTQHIITK